MEILLIFAQALLFMEESISRASLRPAFILKCALQENSGSALNLVFFQFAIKCRAVDSENFSCFRLIALRRL